MPKIEFLECANIISRVLIDKNEILRREKRRRALPYRASSIWFIKYVTIDPHVAFLIAFVLRATKVSANFNRHR